MRPRTDHEWEAWCRRNQAAHTDREQDRRSAFLAELLFWALAAATLGIIGLCLWGAF